MEQREVPPHQAASVQQTQGGADKIAKLEEEIASLHLELSELRQQFAEFKSELGG
jgi:regulator of replication initiation timing